VRSRAAVETLPSLLNISTKDFPMQAPSTSPAAVPTSPFSSWKGDHAGIRVPDFDAAATWYRETLDFRVMQTMVLGEKTLAFLCPAVDETFRIEFIAGPGCTPRPKFEQLSDTHSVGGWHHICFKVDSVDQSIAELKSRSVRIVSEPRDAPSLGLRFAFFCDPWGNLFELSEALSPLTAPAVAN
jgi:catechol 2,3-dioxygenase-like lactoylglutathione lyase family enzyme